MQVKLISARGVELLERTVSTTPFGTFTTSIDLEKDVPLGTYQVTATGAVSGAEIQYGGSFRVEEYRAPQFLVDVDRANGSLSPGDRSREGRRALPLRRRDGRRGRRLDANARPLDAVLRGTPGSRSADRSGMVGRRSPGRPRRRSRLRGGPDRRHGYFAIDAGRAEAPGGRTWSYTLEAEVTDVSRQRVANRARVTVHPAELYAGVRRERGLRRGGEAGRGRGWWRCARRHAPAGLTIDVAVTRRDLEVDPEEGRGRAAGRRSPSRSRSRRRVPRRATARARSPAASRPPTGGLLHPRGHADGRAGPNAEDADRALRDRQRLGLVAAQRHRPDRPGRGQGALRRRRHGAGPGQEPVPGGGSDRHGRARGRAVGPARDARRRGARRSRSRSTSRWSPTSTSRSCWCAAACRPGRPRARGTIPAGPRSSWATSS